MLPTECVGNAAMLARPFAQERRDTYDMNEHLKGKRGSQLLGFMTRGW